ncbi:MULTISPECIES: hypothetical protein [unclassified Microbacterium]|uniref:hypothetical protein n=1 Tax=unclassified Microbacterium TaxID=2609290 RepID=UPI003138E9E9
MQSLQVRIALGLEVGDALSGRVEILLLSPLGLLLRRTRSTTLTNRAVDRARAMTFPLVTATILRDAQLVSDDTHGDDHSESPLAVW